MEYVHDIKLILGAKKANTKSRLLNESVTIAKFEEKFQITTMVDVDSDGKPSKEKMSKLTVYSIAKDKSKTSLGEADLNLCDYGENDYRNLKLPLRKCDDSAAYIEVAIRGTQAQEKTPRGRESIDSNNQLSMALEDLEKEKRATKKIKQDKEEQIRTLTEKINTLQTNLENTKTEVAHLHKQKRGLTEDKERMDKETESLKKKVELRDLSIADKDHEIQKIKDKQKEFEQKFQELNNQIENKKNQTLKEIAEAHQRLEETVKQVRKFYDYERFDIDYLGDAVLFSKADVPQSQNQVVITTPGSRQYRGR
ncbi:UNKNOWN [Stylonychia lemnae]|uniref:C2 NT-type domain-containing protein n=1 Tax=Stylonychia lemnae TaxID=5949 RepID=A0A078A7P3_STYLE|nr:UNKNOWN [Stylonychia lemnae]|eukprot:CDW77592.1 UNKNOWN [Stylonychia lemnae]